MKKISLIVLFLFCLLVTGCFGNTEKNVLGDFRNKLNKSKGYQLTGNLSVNNNDEVFKYDVEVLYLKDHYYKVTLTNQDNQHTQIILKNDDGVYVLTPALNKSFRFQSDWPYQNSQIYLLEALLRDLENDKDLSFEKKDDNYVFKAKVHYPNNSKLIEEKVIFSKSMSPEKIVVYTDDGIEAMSMSFHKIKYSPKLSKDDFSLDTIIDSREEETYNSTSILEDIIYPLFVPSGTKLVGEEKVSKNNGERIIMNYDGEKSFLLVEETADVFDEFTVIPSLGEPYFLMDTLGVMTDNSLSWSSGGIDFYLVSDVMSMEELIEVAQSITGIASIK